MASSSGNDQNPEAPANRELGHASQAGKEEDTHCSHRVLDASLPPEGSDSRRSELGELSHPSTTLEIVEGAVELVEEGFLKVVDHTWGLNTESFIMGASKLKRFNALPTRQQDKMLITTKLRLKMIHGGSRRTQTWDLQHAKSNIDPAVQASRALDEGLDTAGSDFEEQPLELGFEGPKDSSFDEHIVRDKEHHPVGFKVDSQMFVHNLSEGILAHTSLVAGDLIVAVDGTPCSSKSVFAGLIEGKMAFTITVKPLCKPTDLHHPQTAFVKSAQDIQEEQDTMFWNSASQSMYPEEQKAQPESRLAAVEFDITELIGKADTGTLRVPLRRNGDLKCRVSCRYKFLNGNVTEDLFNRMVPEGEVLFEEDSADVHIEVPIPGITEWSTEMVYFVTLVEDSLQSHDPNVTVRLGSNNAVPVYCLNLLSFPNNAHGPRDSKHEAVNEGASVLSLYHMIYHFLMHNAKILPAETKRGLIYSILPGLLYYLERLLFKRIVDGVFESTLPRAAQSQGEQGPFEFSFAPRGMSLLVTCGACIVVLQVFKQIVAVLFRRLRLGGKATLKLRVNIFATMLQLSTSAKENFDDGDIPKCLDTEVSASIEGVWLEAFRVWRRIWLGVSKLILASATGGRLTTRDAVLAASAIPFMVVVASVLLCCSSRILFQKRRSSYNADQNWAALVGTCHSNALLIVSYGQGWIFSDAFKTLHAKFNDAAFAATSFEYDMIVLLRFVFSLLVFAIIVIEGSAVQNGHLSVGEFIITNAAIVSCGEDMVEIHKMFSTIVAGSSAVGDISLVLNSETRRFDRMKRFKGDLRRQSTVLIRSTGDIRLQKVKFGYRSTLGDTAVSPLNVIIKSGSLACFPRVGLAEMGCSFGINTLLKVLSGELTALSGEVNIPVQWKRVYVPPSPILFDGTLMYNLQFGDGVGFPPKKVWDVCRALGMSRELIEQDDFDVGNNAEFMKFSDRIIVSIARALLHDVDLLLISSALDMLGESRGVKALRFLRLYTEHRGFPDKQLPADVRHCKTVIYTSKFDMLQRQAHRYLRVPLHLGRNTNMGKVDEAKLIAEEAKNEAMEATVAATALGTDIKLFAARRLIESI